VDKQRNLVQLIPNKGQQAYLDTHLNKEKYSGYREVILKARQHGFSTLIVALFFLDSYNNANTNSVIVAQKESTATELLDKVRTMFEGLPSEDRLDIIEDNANRVKFSNGSYIKVATAKSPDALRGTTAHNVLFTEMAFYPENSAKQLIAAANNIVPFEGNIFIESTANGIGNTYHAVYNDASEGKSRFRASFTPWYISPEYSIPLEPGEELNPYDYDHEQWGNEMYLVNTYGVTVEQLKWRREKLRETNTRDALDLFKQEYPSNAQEAFLATGTTYFNAELLKELEERAVKPIPFPVNQYRSPVLYSYSNVGNGFFTFFELPKDSNHYLMVVDVSEGENLSGKADYSAIHVYDRRTNMQVFSFRSRDIKPLRLADLIFELYDIFHRRCLIAVERNNHGYTVVANLAEIKGIPRMTSQWDFGLFVDINTNLKAAKLKFAKTGWLTTNKSKTQAIEALNLLLEHDEIGINCPVTINELRNFSQLKGGKYGAILGHDDMVTCCWIGAFILNNFIPKTRSSNSKKGKLKSAVEGRQFSRFM
jgi:hypothetical protein